MLAFHECSSGSYAQEVIRGQPAGARVLECPLLALALSSLERAATNTDFVKHEHYRCSLHINILFCSVYYK